MQVPSKVNNRWTHRAAILYYNLAVDKRDEALVDARLVEIWRCNELLYCTQ